MRGVGLDVWMSDYQHPTHPRHTQLLRYHRAMQQSLTPYMHRPTRETLVNWGGMFSLCTKKTCAHRHQLHTCLRIDIREYPSAPHTICTLHLTFHIYPSPTPSAPVPCCSSTTFPWRRLMVTPWWTVAPASTNFFKLMWSNDSKLYLVQACLLWKTIHLVCITWSITWAAMCVSVHTCGEDEPKWWNFKENDPFSPLAG